MSASAPSACSHQLSLQSLREPITVAAANYAIAGLLYVPPMFELQATELQPAERVSDIRAVSVENAVHALSPQCTGCKPSLCIRPIVPPLLPLYASGELPAHFELVWRR